MLLMFFSSASVIVCSSLSEPAIRSISSTNLRLLNCLLPIDMLDSWFVTESSIIFSRNILNRTGDNKHPCLIPTVVLNFVPIL